MIDVYYSYELKKQIRLDHFDEDAKLNDMMPTKIILKNRLTAHFVDGIWVVKKSIDDVEFLDARLPQNEWIREDMFGRDMDTDSWNSVKADPRFDSDSHYENYEDCKNLDCVKDYIASHPIPYLNGDDWVVRYNINSEEVRICELNSTPQLVQFVKSNLNLV